MAGGNQNTAGAGTSRSDHIQDGPIVDVEAMMTLMHGMVPQLSAQQQNKEAQDQQIALLRDGLLAA